VHYEASNDTFIIWSFLNLQIVQSFVPAHMAYCSSISILQEYREYARGGNEFTCVLFRNCDLSSTICKEMIHNRFNTARV